MQKTTFLFILLWITLSALSAQTLLPSEIKQAARQSLDHSLLQYRQFLSIPNIGSFPEQRQANVDWCVQQFNQLGFETQVLHSKEIPHVLATWEINPNYETLLFYLQIDGQPVDSSEWNQPHPFKPVLKKKMDKEWQIVDWSILADGFDPDLRVFARSASDSKGPAMTFITALQILQQKGIQPKFNIKVIMDFQEELGSPTLSPLVESKRDLFQAKMMLIMDGTRHVSNLPTLTFGARGIATVQLRVFGAVRNLHSGQYGNFAPNPVFHLARVLGQLKDENGRVLIPHFYDGVHLSNAEKALINSVPEDLAMLKKSLGIATIDSVGTTYQEALQYPSLNIRGLKAAWVEQEVRTLLPNEAIAEIDMRLVPETPGERQVQLLQDFLQLKGFHLIDSLPTVAERQTYPKLMQFTYKLGSKPFRTNMQSPIGDWLSKAMDYIFGDRHIKMRTTGGSQPIAPFITTLGLPAVSVRIPNPDNSIHAPNENLRLGNYLEGIETCLSILVQEMN